MFADGPGCWAQCDAERALGAGRSINVALLSLALARFMSGPVSNDKRGSRRLQREPSAARGWASVKAYERSSAHDPASDVFSILMVSAIR